MPRVRSHRPQASDSPGSPPPDGPSSARPGTRSPPRSCPARRARRARRRTRTPRTRRGPGHASARRGAAPRRPSGRTRRASRSGVNAPTTPSSNTPAVCTTPVRRVLVRHRASSAATWSRSATSHATTDTAAPARSARRPAPRTPSAAGPRRLTSTSCRTPCRATRCRATRAPKRAGAAGDQDRPVRAEHRAVRRRVDPVARASRGTRQPLVPRIATCGSPRPVPAPERPAPTTPVRGRDRRPAGRSGRGSRPARRAPDPTPRPPPDRSPHRHRRTAPRVTTTSRDVLRPGAGSQRLQHLQHPGRSPPAPRRRRHRRRPPDHRPPGRRRSRPGPSTSPPVATAPTTATAPRGPAAGRSTPPGTARHRPCGRIPTARRTPPGRPASPSSRPATGLVRGLPQRVRPARREPHPQRRRARRVQPQPVPREGQHRPGRPPRSRRATSGVQGGVEQRRVDAELAGVLALSSGSATSANTSSPRRHTARSPWKAGP